MLVPYTQFYGALISLTIAALLGCREDVSAPTPSEPDFTVASSQASLAFLQMSGGANHSCGITTDRRLYCWGWNFNGQLGDGSTASRSTPVAVGGALRFRQVSAAGGHTCGVTQAYELYCWGWNLFGQLGDGTTADRQTPVAVAGGLRFRSVAGGSAHTCAISYPDSRTYCWGFNGSGHLGDGTTSRRLTPAAVMGTMRFREVSTGDDHTCGVTTESRAFCWGDNHYGQIGDSTEVAQRLVPTRVATTRQFRQLDAGRNHSCAVTTDNRVYCWGNGRQGALGNGKAYLSFWPRAVAGGLSFERVTGGAEYTCGETTGNRAYCWGWNVEGMLGDGTTTNRLTPVAVKGGLYFRQLSAGGWPRVRQDFRVRGLLLG